MVAPTLRSDLAAETGFFFLRDECREAAHAARDGLICTREGPALWAVVNQWNHAKAGGSARSLRECNALIPVHPPDPAAF